jgi:hypothetical protein
VWQTAPIPMIPNQASMWRALFIASVATRSPGRIPFASNADEKRRARSATSA